MTRIWQNGIKYLAFLILLSCSEKKITFYELQENNNKKIDSKEYYIDNNQLSLELRAIYASFRGDYRKALDLNSQLAHKKELDDVDNHSSMIQYLKNKISDTATSQESLIKMKKILSWYQGINKKDSIFKNFTSKNALSQIVKESMDYHFTLINEAHYSSLHRSFTNSLLKPMWEKGYRYLALEGIGYDEYIQSRGYAIYDSGYYTRESSYANLIRNALKIGYIIVPYESKTKRSGSSRDLEQAENIYKATIKKDKKGKVLVHVGYSHIFENGDENYVPLGAQLKKLTNMDILTIDQVRMCEQGSPDQENSYYKFALKNVEVNEPTVFINSEQTYLVDPINAFGVDMQVYHPKTNYILGRPEWLINDNNGIYPLPESYNKLKGFFVQAIKKDEIDSGIPYDQFIIDSVETGIILEKGVYILRIFDKSGKLFGTSKVKVNY